jgi:putative hydrolase of the HAD superfamily
MKAVIFDLDNTLIDFMKMKRLACRAAVDAMIKAGLKADRKHTFTLLFKLYDRYGYEYKEIFQALLKKLTGKVDYGIVAAGIVAYRKVRERMLLPYLDVIPTLNKLRRKGVKLAIVTDAPRIEAWIRLAAMGIQDKFKAVITYDDSKQKKPSLKPFKLALKKLKVKSSEVIVVGDSISRDIVPAKRLGAKAVLTEYGIVKKEKKEREVVKPDFKIKRLSEVLLFK